MIAPHRIDVLHPYDCERARFMRALHQMLTDPAVPREIAAQEYHGTLAAIRQLAQLAGIEP